MNSFLRLIITTPSTVLVDGHATRSVRAHDASGSFGILPNHIDLITVLDDSVVRWSDMSDKTHYCAVRRGVLMVSEGKLVRIACREGLTGDNLTQLDARIRDSRTLETDKNREETTRQMRLHTQTMRHIMGFLRSNSRPIGARKGGTPDENLTV